MLLGLFLYDAVSAKLTFFHYYNGYKQRFSLFPGKLPAHFCHYFHLNSIRRKADR
jgi:hypothetical protein